MRILTLEEMQLVSGGKGHAKAAKGHGSTKASSKSCTAGSGSSGKCCGAAGGSSSSNGGCTPPPPPTGCGG